MKAYLALEFFITIALLAAVYVETGFFTVLTLLLTAVYMWREVLDEGYASIIQRIKSKLEK